VNIYVGNLPYKATEEDLRQVFEEFGTVTSTSMIIDRETGRPRGFAFVEMANDNEGAKAIEAMNGTEWMGRLLSVNEARPREQQPQRPRGSFGGGHSGGGGYSGGGDSGFNRERSSEGRSSGGGGYSGGGGGGGYSGGGGGGDRGGRSDAGRGGGGGGRRDYDKRRNNDGGFRKRTTSKDNDKSKSWSMDEDDD
jgi:RNA recognition motif-containing protein